MPLVHIPHGTLILREPAFAVGGSVPQEILPSPPCKEERIWAETSLIIKMRTGCQDDLKGEVGKKKKKEIANS